MVVTAILSSDPTKSIPPYKSGVFNSCIIGIVTTFKAGNLVEGFRSLNFQDSSDAGGQSDDRKSAKELVEEINNDNLMITFFSVSKKALVNS